MKKLFLFSLAAFCLQADTSNLRLINRSNTQAIIGYTCPDFLAATIEASKDPTFTTLADDVNPAIFTGASSDASRVLQTGVNDRIAVIGLRTAATGADGRRHSRALATDSYYYVRVTCSSGLSQTIKFHTDVPNSLAPEALDTDPTTGEFGNLKLPDFDFSDLSKPVIDPKTGLEIYTAAPEAHSDNSILTLTANWYSGGSGWTNPANISGYGSTVATTANTNPLAVFIDPRNTSNYPWYGGNWPYDNLLDFGVELYGSGTDASSTNRTVQAALSCDSGQTASTPYLSLALPQTTNAAAGKLPSTYPLAYFRGWGAAVPRRCFPKRGYVSISGNTVTLQRSTDDTPIGSYSVDTGAFFDHDWPAGVKLNIGENFYTIASVQNGTQLTLVETPGLGSTITSVTHAVNPALTVTAHGYTVGATLLMNVLGGAALAISSATNANPTVFTSTAHGFAAGSHIVPFSGGTGAWAALNGTQTITVIDANTFSVAIDSTSFGTFTTTLEIDQWQNFSGLLKVSVTDANTLTVINLAALPFDATHYSAVRGTITLQPQYVSANMAVILKKSNTTGSINVSARARAARGYSYDIWTGGCSKNSVTTTKNADGTDAGRTITGYPCVMPRTRQEHGGLWFVPTSEPGSPRLLSLFRNPGTLPGHTSADSIGGGFTQFGPMQSVFDPTDPRVMYIAATTNGGSPGLFQVTYTGDWSSLATAYQATSADPVASGELTIVNLTKSATSRDMRSQILANTPYDESKYGALTALANVGIAGPYSIFQHSIGAQESACWIFAFESTTGNFYRYFRTDDGSNAPELKFAGCHSVNAVAGAYLFLSSNGLHWSNTGMPYGGPFVAPVASVKQVGGTFASIPLPWPPDSSYDSSCPSLPQKMIDNGGVNGQCVTIRAKQPCSSFGVVNEHIWSPCAWDSTKSQVASWAVGDWVKDYGTDFDGESFQIGQVTDLGGGLVELVLQRNASISYCSIGKKESVDSIANMQHAAGFTIYAAPYFSCQSAGLMIDIVANTAYSVNRNLVGGHFDVLPGSANGRFTWEGGSNLGFTVGKDRTLDQLNAVSDYAVNPYPSFGGLDGGLLNYVQSYPEAPHTKATPNLLRYAFNFRHYNGPSGLDLESPSQTIGNATNATLQAGTTSVYKVSVTGTPDEKRNVLTAWAGPYVITDVSSAATGNILTDATPWTGCRARATSECRTGSSIGDYFMVVPHADLKTSCWASQVNLRTPCAFAGPPIAMQAIQLRMDQSDPQGQLQRLLGTLLMGPSQQYVYSKLIPMPDASTMLFAGFLTHGYHSALMSFKLPRFSEDSAAKNTFTPVTIKGGTGNNVYVEFGYEEFGSRTQFYCTSRKEACHVSGSSINEAVPFKYASEFVTTVSGSYKIQIPGIHGRVLYYRLVENGVSGDLRVAMP
jgi:hypothetical protein